MYHDHLAELADGTVTALTTQGRYTELHLVLNRDYLVAWRSERRFLLEDIIRSERLISRVERAALVGLDSDLRTELAALIQSHRDLCVRLKREY
jgi:hypothetical protein